MSSLVGAVRRRDRGGRLALEFQRARLEVVALPLAVHRARLERVALLLRVLHALAELRELLVLRAQLRLEEPAQLLGLHAGPALELRGARLEVVALPLGLRHAPAELRQLLVLRAQLRVVEAAELVELIELLLKPLQIGGIGPVDAVQPVVRLHRTRGVDRGQFTARRGHGRIWRRLRGRSVGGRGRVSGRLMPRVPVPPGWRHRGPRRVPVSRARLRGIRAGGLVGVHILSLPSCFSDHPNGADEPLRPAG